MITPFRLFFYGREDRPRCESRLIRIKPGKEFAKRPKKKGNKELKTKAVLETVKDSKLNCHLLSASSREISEKTPVETVTNESLSKLKEINKSFNTNCKRLGGNALDTKTQKMTVLESKLPRLRKEIVFV